MKYYDLKKWDKALHWGQLLTFHKIDGIYAQWIDEKWNIKIWNSMNYELKNWIYYPN